MVEQVSRSESWRKVVGFALLLVSGGWLVTDGLLWLTTGTQVPVIGVAWAAGITPDQRVSAEKELSLVPWEPKESRYLLIDASPQSLRRLVSHPLVADTQGIERGPNVLAHPPMVRRWLGDSHPALKAPGLLYLSVFGCLAS